MIFLAVPLTSLRKNAPYAPCVSAIWEGRVQGSARVLAPPRTQSKESRITLFDTRAPLVEAGRDDGVRVAQDADEVAGERLVRLAEKGDRLARAAGTTGATDAVDVLRARE